MNQPVEIVITSRNNPWVQQWLRYQAKPALRKVAGLAWLEGEHLVFEALKRGVTTAATQFVLENIVVPESPAGQATLARLTSHFGAQTRHEGLANPVRLGESVFKTLCTLDSTPSVCAVLRVVQAQRLDAQLATVVLDGVQDPGNVGTVIRLCAAFGVAQVLLSKGCASAWSAKALRAGQGAQLAVQVLEEVDLNAAYAAFKRSGLPLAATTLSNESVPLNAAQIQQQMVWVFGNEGQGISATTAAAATQAIHIPMQGGFESLNIGSAAAICLWQWQQLCAINQAA